MESCRHGKRPRAGRERREHEEEEVDIPGAAIDGHGRGGGPTGRSVERGGGDKGGGMESARSKGGGLAGLGICRARLQRARPVACVDSSRATAKSERARARVMHALGAHGNLYLSIC